MEDLATSLKARLQRFTDEGDASEVLDSGAVEGAVNFWAAYLRDKRVAESRWDALAIMANLHLARWQSLPEDDDVGDALMAVAFCRVLATMDDAAIPDEVRSILSENPLEPADDVELLARAGHLAYQEHWRAGHAGVLSAAIRALRDAADFTSFEDGRRGLRLSDLGLALFAESELTGSKQDLDAAVNMSRWAVISLHSDRQDASTVQERLALFLSERFEQRGDLRDLDAAIVAGREAVRSSPNDDSVQARYLSALSEKLISRFDLANNLEDLHEAVAALRRALSFRQPSSLTNSIRLSQLGSALLTRFEMTGNPKDIIEAVDACQLACDSLPSHSGHASEILSNLGTALYNRFGILGNLDDLDAAIAAGERALAAGPAQPERAAVISNLASSVLKRFELTGDISDLETAVRIGREALDAGPEGLHRVAVLSNLSAVLRTRFSRIGNVADLDAAIAAGQEAAAIPAGRSEANILSTVGMALATRYEHSGNPADLDAAIDAARRAAAITPAGAPQLCLHLSNLGNHLAKRFDQAGNSADLDAAIDAAQQAVAATPAGHSQLAGHLSSLGRHLCTRFGQTGSLADLEAAVTAAQHAAAVIPAGHTDTRLILSGLGNALLDRFHRTGNASDLDGAVSAIRDAAAGTPTDHPSRAASLTTLGVALRERFLRTGDTADLNAAIETGQAAVATAPADHLKLPMMQSLLGMSLLKRFEYMGNTADLDAAIDAVRRCLAVTPPDQPARIGRLSDLAYALLTRFELAGDTTDLDTAIAMASEAVTTAPPSYAEMAPTLSGLCLGLLRRYEQDEDIHDINAAVEAGRAALDASPPGHTAQAGILSNFALASLRRFEHNGSREDLDAAISADRDALACSPAGDPHIAGVWSNLGLCLKARFELTGDPGDLEASVDAGQQAITAAAPDAPNLAPFFYNLGGYLRARYEHMADRADLDAAISCWRQASALDTASPKVRVSAAGLWGTAAAEDGRIHEASEALTLAVHLLPLAAWHGLNRASRQQQLTQWIGLAGAAGASAVRDGRPEDAVMLLEQGRSVLWTQALNLRSDLTSLAEKEPNLARQLDEIRKILDSPAQDPAPYTRQTLVGTLPVTGRGHEQGERRKRLAREWDNLLAQVRAIEGFENFLQVAPYAELAAAALDGPVIVLNVSSFGCHALVVRSGNPSVQVVHLPDLTLDTAASNADKMTGALDGASDVLAPLSVRDAYRKDILQVLGWLWDTVAEPVLTALGHQVTPATDEKWPRVWWCPTGPLTILPIHAAGHHADSVSGTTPTKQSVLDRVVSSYAPTLSALIRARQPRSALAHHLRVGMQFTPRMPELPAVPAEMAVLECHFPAGEGNEQLTDAQATRAAVADAISTHSWIHLACHASQQHSDPSHSGFALWDGTLTISDLIDQPSQHRDLAFLSACQTATGSVRHLDEAIHIAAAMQFLGYRHVIATMWSVADSLAPDVARIVYGVLTERGTPDTTETAAALHYAVQLIRDQNPANPLLWAPYIHLGT